MNDIPLISALMCVHNGARFLDEALASVAAQTFTSYEFVIVDDGSTDGTADILERVATCDSRIRVIRLEHNVGLTAALNIGLDVSVGRYIARLDDDDRCHPQRFSRQLEFLERNPDYVAVASGFRFIDEAGQHVRTVNDALRDWQIRWLAGFNPPAPHPTFFFRRIGPDGCAVRYDESFETAQDFDFWSRMALMGKTAVLGEVLVDYRRHNAAISMSKRANQAKNCQRAARQNLSRQFDCDQLSQLEPFLEAFAYERTADTRTIRAVIKSLDVIWSAGLVSAHSFKDRLWVRAKAAGLLADTLLSRCGALRNPVYFLAFCLFGWRYLPGLAIAIMDSPGLALKSIAQVNLYRNVKAPPK